MPNASERETGNISEWESSVGKEVGYELEGRGIGVRFLAGSTDFSVFLGVQINSGAYPASYPMITRAPSPGLKWPGREASRLPAPNDEVMDEWSYAFTSPYVLMA